MNRSCTVIPETCPLPKVCYQVKNATTGEIDSSFCGCLSNQGFTGPNCDEMSAGTMANIVLAALVLLVCVLYFGYGAFYIGRLVVLEFSIKQKRRLNESVLASIFALFNLLFLIIYLVLWDFETAYPTRVSYTTMGVRVSFLYTPREVFIALGVSCAICGLLILSITFYEVAYHTRKMKQLRDLNYVRRVAFISTFVIAIVTLILIGLQQMQAVYIFLACIGFIGFTFLGFTSFRLTKELNKKTSLDGNKVESNNSQFGILAVKVRNASIFLLISGILAILGSIMTSIFLYPEHGVFSIEFIGWIIAIIGLIGMSLSLINFTLEISERSSTIKEQEARTITPIDSNMQ